MALADHFTGEEAKRAECCVLMMFYQRVTIFSYRHTKTTGRKHSGRERAKNGHKFKLNLVFLDSSKKYSPSIREVNQEVGKEKLFNRMALMMFIHAEMYP